jgi:hypothetical protein
MYWQPAIHQGWSVLTSAVFLLGILLLQLEVVDPGTVLMWIFGSILALLWLMFVFYGE